MNTQTMTSLPEVTTANIKLALESIKQFVTQKNYVITGNLDSLTNVPPRFSSNNQEKKFRWSLLRVTNHPSMRSANMFLSHLAKATWMTKLKVDYSEREKQIKTAKKEWKEVQAKADQARLKYKEIKGDFYKTK